MRRWEEPREAEVQPHGVGDHLDRVPVPLVQRRRPRYARSPPARDQLEDRLTSSANVTVPLIVFWQDSRVVLALRLDETTSADALTSGGVSPEVQVCRLQPPRGRSVAGAAAA
jgi:hypothetical protein